MGAQRAAAVPHENVVAPVAVEVAYGTNTALVGQPDPVFLLVRVPVPYRYVGPPEPLRVRTSPKPSAVAWSVGPGPRR
ncbi:hypothetical protein GCM10023238_36390 [Streptomyces heliomycini]